jgi:formate hydrogenlyase transcriptional activator
MFLSRDALVSVADSLGTHLPGQQAFKILGKILHDVHDVDRLSLAMYDPRRNDFNVVAVELDTGSRYGSGTRLLRQGTRVGVAFDTQQPKVGADLQADQRFPEDRFLAAEGMLTGLTLPLIVSGTSIGTLNVDWRRKVALHSRTIDLFTAVAATIARGLRVSSWPSNAVTGATSDLSADRLSLQRPSLQKHATRLRKYAASGATILLCGETGSGKGVLASALHKLSRRAAAPFVKCDCSALTASLIESELFGHERGSFTGAATQRIGRFELASGGTIFLDEIGEFEGDLQPKLLSVIEDQELMRVGNSRPVKIDVRVIAGTNRNLEDEVAQKRFREDLYHRLCVLRFELPALRDCPEDLHILAKSFVRKIAMEAGVQPPAIDERTLNSLRAYHWPGNVRELGNVLQRAMVLNEGAVLRIEPDLFGSQPKRIPACVTTLAEVEARHIGSVLRARNWKVGGRGGAAELLGVHPNTLRSRMEKLGVKRPRTETRNVDAIN